MTYAVIMAGGAGSRFWPKSRIARPKQFVSLFGEQTMLQKTIQRLSGFADAGRVLVVTNESYLSIVQQQAPNLREQFVIGEKVARNTAPCVAAAAALLYEQDPDAVMVVLPADHEIGKPETFLSVLRSASELASKRESLVTIGIEPNRPETGYGYIRRKEEELELAGDHKAYPVMNFTEKPDSETASGFLASSDYYWNSGMFIWKVSVIVEAFKKHLPEIYQGMEKLMKSEKRQEDMDQFYLGCPSVSIDYGIMEKAEKVDVIPAEFGWNDVGSWTAVHELSEKDADNNASGGANTLFLESQSNLVHSDSGKLIALIGLDDIAVVETDDAIMVMPLHKAQKVKELYEKIKSDPLKKEYL